MELLLKHAQYRDGLTLIKDIMQQFIQPLLAKSGTDNYIISMLNYALDQGEVKNLEVFFELINNKLPKEAEQKVMTIAELLRQQGLRQGEALLFIELLKYRFGNLNSDSLARINKADATTLLKWGKRIFEAKNIEEIFN